MAIQMQSVSSPTAETTPPKLRWYQWRLRSMFILTLVVAIACSWIAVEMRNERREKAAADAIVKAGGTVKSEPTWLGRLLGDESLVTVSEVGTNDGVFGPLRSGPLQPPFLRNARQITDAELIHLEGLKQLRTLDLNATPITDAGLLHLEGLKQLQSFALSKTKVTDAGLVHLEGLQQLQMFILNHTKITDAGLVHLEGLQQLHLLVLNDTGVTDQGIKKLQKALPNCTILR
jgi:hypothetical protein